MVICGVGCMERAILVFFCAAGWQRENSQSGFCLSQHGAFYDLSILCFAHSIFIDTQSYSCEIKLKMSTQKIWTTRFLFFCFIVTLIHYLSRAQSWWAITTARSTLWNESWSRKTATITDQKVLPSSQNCRLRLSHHSCTITRQRHFVHHLHVDYLSPNLIISE